MARVHQQRPADESGRRSLLHRRRGAVVAASIVGGVILLMELIIGGVHSTAEAHDMVAHMVSPVTAMCQAVVGSMATVLALMLAMLSISPQLDRHLPRDFYEQVQTLSLLSIVDMVAAITLMLILGTPARTAARQVGYAGFVDISLVYYCLVGLTAIVAGLFVAVIVLLYNAIVTIIHVVSPGPP